MKKNSFKIFSLFLALSLCISMSGCMGLPIFSDDNYNLWGHSNNSYAKDNWQYSDLQQNKWEGSQNVYAREEAIRNGAVREKFITPIGNNQDKVTVMIYICGSDLESEDGSATKDLNEMMEATLSDNINVVVQTGGTKNWHNNFVSPDTSQRFIIKDNKPQLIQDNLGQLDMTSGETLEDFIKYCNTNYPANRNMLILWDHGCGPVYGFGGDEYKGDSSSLTLDEIQTALKNSNVLFDFIGFDACIMGCIEVAYALADYSDYLIASEDFESGYGWQYANWLTLLGENSSIDTPTLSKTIIDDFIKDSGRAKSSGILTLVDLTFTRLLFNAWTEFAYSAKNELLENNYTFDFHRSDRALKSIFGYDLFDNNEDEYSYNIIDFSATDIMAVASTINTEQSKALTSAVGLAVVYSASTEEDKSMTGIHVTLPYNDSQLYHEQKKIYARCGFSSEYIEFLGEFVHADSSDYDWGEWDWNGWDDYEDDGYNWDEYDWDSYDWDTDSWNEDEWYENGYWG